MGEDSGVVCVLVFGVELNSEQFSTKSQSEQPVWSSTGATKHKTGQLSLLDPNISPEFQKNFKHSTQGVPALSSPNNLSST